MIISAGNIVADHVAQPVAHYPPKGACYHVQRMGMYVGGCASNTGLAIAKLGLPVQVVGRVGRDWFGEFVIQTLEAHGVDTRGIVRSETASTSQTMVMVHPDGERSFIHLMGTNAEFGEHDVRWEVLDTPKVFHLAGAFLTPAMDGEPASRVLRQAKARGALTTLDTTWDHTGRGLEILRPCLPLLDYILPNLEEARQISRETEPERIADRLLSEGVGTVVIKMGGDGCYVKNRETAFHLPAYPVEVVDTLGAGDCFCAGFITGLALGWDLERVARLANAVGALCVTALGATTGVRSLEETLAFAGIEAPA
ncbi:MAG: carbohydrate kinase family protein [Fimbriimonadales bacterium]